MQIILQNTYNSTIKDELRKEITNKGWRYLAHRQSVYWINHWTNFGKGKRVVLPACVVLKIRNTFPEDSGIYVGFKANKEETHLLEI